MFFVNGKNGRWSIKPANDESGFTVVNNLGDVSLKVNDVNYKDIIKEIKPEEGTDLVVTDVYPDNLIIKYNMKTMTPEAYCIGERKGSSSIISAVSIQIPNGFRIFSIYNADVRILSYSFDADSYIDLIGNFTKKKESTKSPHLSITAVNMSSRQAIVYSVFFSPKTAKVKVTTRKYNFEAIPKKGERGHINLTDFVSQVVASGHSVIKKFYPAIPTEAIITKGEESEVNEVFKIEKAKRWNSIDNYTIVENVDNSIVPEIAKSGFNAVTLFIKDIPVNLDILKDEAWVKYFGETGELIKNTFETIFVLGANGSIIRVKLDGEYQG